MTILRWRSIIDDWKNLRTISLDNSDLRSGHAKPLETGIGTGICRTKRKDGKMHNGVGSIKEESGSALTARIAVKDLNQITPHEDINNPALILSIQW